MFNIKDPNDVPGYIFQSQIDQIQELAKTLPPNANVLEIGCAWGRSTWCWLNALPEGSTLTTVDIFMFDNRPGKHTKRMASWWKNPVVDQIMEYYCTNGQEACVKKVLEEHPRKHLIKEIYKGSSRSFYERHPQQQWDCVYLDGDHAYDAIKEDIKNFEPNTKIICGDDYEPITQPGVVQAVTEMTTETGRTLWVDPGMKNGVKKDKIYYNAFWVARK